MKIKNRSLKTAVIIVSSLFGVLILFLLWGWTKSIDSAKRQNELKKTMREVLGIYGEKGFLEMAGVPVNNIFYGDEGLTLFNGDNATWQYSADELQNISVFEKCNKAVVHISTHLQTGVSDVLNAIPETGVGSGFFISGDGYIITNSHVIEDADSILVTTWNSEKYTASVKGLDEENDIAVLKVKPETGKVFDFLEFGDSASLAVGQKVLAIGNPFGFDRTMASGIISGLARPIRNDEGRVLLGMVQTDTPINPGSSGGPLLNAKGKVVGISTSIYSSTGTAQGMNFAVASNTASSSAQDIIKYGKINRGWLDIVPIQLTKQIVDYASLKVEKGILVSQVVHGGKADKAGLRGGFNQVRYGSSIIYLGGDVITAVNGLEVSEYGDLFTALSNTRPGDKVSVVVNRNGKDVKLSIELVERNSENVGLISR